jgi:hypothetical protein
LAVTSSFRRANDMGCAHTTPGNSHTEGNKKYSQEHAGTMAPGDSRRDGAGGAQAERVAPLAPPPHTHIWRKCVCTFVPLMVCVCVCVCVRVLALAGCGVTEVVPRGLCTTGAHWQAAMEFGP